MAIRKLPRWLNLLLILLVAGVWVYNGYKMATGFQQMRLHTRFDSVMFLLLGPVFVWKDLVQTS